jgi:hypothetical protein
MERADPKEKSTEQIATGKTEAPGPEASDKSIISRTNIRSATLCPKIEISEGGTSV